MEGAELIDSVLDVIRREAESCDYSAKRGRLSYLEELQNDIGQTIILTNNKGDDTRLPPLPNVTAP